MHSRQNSVRWSRFWASDKYWDQIVLPWVCDWQLIIINNIFRRFESENSSSYFRDSRCIGRLSIVHDASINFVINGSRKLCYVGWKVILSLLKVYLNHATRVRNRNGNPICGIPARPGKLKIAGNSHRKRNLVLIPISYPVPRKVSTKKLESKNKHIQSAGS